ncbi:hypothetical protein CP061683_1227, partial [Chlamydia psittaci 06-1683]
MCFKNARLSEAIKFSPSP